MGNTENKRQGIVTRTNKPGTRGTGKQETKKKTKLGATETGKTEGKTQQNEATTRHRARKTQGLNTHWSTQGLGDRRVTQLGEIRLNETREAKPETLT